MVTGTGKTRTVLGMIYRFLKAEQFRRILFLVDRNSLGEQAQDVFATVKLEDLLPLDKIYNITKLGDKTFGKETRLQIATVQSMVKRVLYAEDSIPGVSDFDLIIVDEAHRGYLVDHDPPHRLKIAADINPESAYKTPFDVSKMNASLISSLLLICSRPALTCPLSTRLRLCPRRTPKNFS